MSERSGNPLRSGRGAVNAHTDHPLRQPRAWLLEPVVQRYPDKPIQRGCYTSEPTAEQREIAALDGDRYVPLYEERYAASLERFILSLDAHKCGEHYHDVNEMQREIGK